MGCELNTPTKASALLVEVLDLDKQIIALDKIALSVCDKKQSASLSFSFPKEKKAEIDTDGYSNKYTSMFSMLNPYAMMERSEPATDDHRFEIDEVETMAICGVLIQVKKDRRKMIVMQLMELGYTY